MSETADELLERATDLRIEADELERRARDLRSDRRTFPRSVRGIAAEMEVSERTLVDAAKTGRFEAWRLGGEARGELLTTLANVEAYLRSQPAVRKLVAEPTGSDSDVYDLAVRRAGGTTR